MNQAQVIVNGRSTWEQWDAQEAKRIKLQSQHQAWIELNNEYCMIERGVIKLNLWHSNHLLCLVSQAYDQDDFLREWWLNELTKLPDWNNF